MGYIYCFLCFFSFFFFAMYPESRLSCLMFRARNLLVSHRGSHALSRVIFRPYFSLPGSLSSVQALFLATRLSFSRYIQALFFASTLYFFCAGSISRLTFRLSFSPPGSVSCAQTSFLVLYSSSKSGIQTRFLPYRLSFSSCNAASPGGFTVKTTQAPGLFCCGVLNINVLF